MKHLQEYLEMTGQSMQELFGGLMMVGPQEVEELMQKALREKKKIVGIDESLQTGQGHYELYDL